MLCELGKVVKMAREQAILGMYNEAVEHFGEAIQMLNSHLQQSPGGALESRWKRAKQDLNEELEATKRLVATLERFSGYLAPAAVPRNDQPIPTMLNQQQAQFPISVSNPNYRGPQNFNRFQNPPFAHHQSFEEDPSDTFNNMYSEPKDPDVWAPPPSKPAEYKPQKPKPRTKSQYQPPGNQSKPQPPNKRSALAKNVKPQNNPVDGAKAQRNYDRPWMKNTKQENEEPKKAEAGRSEFLDHVYGDGDGPDSELIMMLERDIMERNPNVSFDSIAELDEAKQLLQEAVLWPIMMPELFTGLRRPPRGVLLYGPPGTGKTMLAKAIATSGKTTFFNVSASSLASKWRGESEKLVRILFEMARFYAPTTIFFDEIDSLGSKRGESSEHEASRRVKTELLIQMDGVSSSAGEGEERKAVMVLAATNRPWDLDEALRRRLEKRICNIYTDIALPNKLGRKQLFEIYLKDSPVSSDINFDTLVNGTQGYSGADIFMVCREAAMFPMRRKMLEIQKKGGLNTEVIQKLKQEINIPITMQDLEEALKNVGRSVSNDDMEAFDKWKGEFGSV